jgi:hypothetical protein
MGARRCRTFPCWNAWLLKLVPGTRGSPKCRLRSHQRGTVLPSLAPLSIGAVGGAPSKHGGIQIEAQAEQQQQRHQAAAQPLLADLDSESVQAAIQRLFDAGIMLEDSAFRDFVGTLRKLSLELVSIQSGVDVGAGAGIWEGVFDVEEDNTLPASSLSARNGLAGGGLVGYIFRRRWCVLSTCLCLPQLREWSKQQPGNFDIARPGTMLSSIFNVL